jgi:two-component system, NtrC family, nitrogen regulation response regulator NtrX
MAHNILVIDDQEDIRNLIAGILQDEGYTCRLASNCQQAIEAIKERKPHLLILDVWLNDSRFDGIEMLDIIKQTYPDLPVVMISGHSTIETAVNALKKGADDFIEKPFKTDRLLHVVSKGLEKYRLKQELHALRSKTLDAYELHGTSPKIQQLRQQAEKIAKTNSRVLIEGAAGTGKEVVARLLHQSSPRGGNPFVMVNCAAIPVQNFEEEFFGTEGKAGTPALTIKLGFLEKADGGTLFLDNVGDLPHEMQGKLLQVLQDQRFQRVGSNKAIKVDVRVLAATSIDLKERIKQGQFREDLFYRLAVVPLMVPSLAEHPEDVLPIAQQFLKQVGINAAFTEEAKFMLESYEWPGNVRQLKNVIEWTHIMNPDIKTSPISPDHLPPEFRKQTLEMTNPEVNTHFMSLPLRDAREEFEKVYLNMHIKRFNGNITKTANAIGMERTALHRKIKLLSLISDESLSKLVNT